MQVKESSRTPLKDKNGNRFRQFMLMPYIAARNAILTVLHEKFSNVGYALFRKLDKRNPSSDVFT